MAIDGNFLAFLVPAAIALLAAAVGFPSKGRIEEDPSTAFKGGRKAIVSISTVFALIMGVILAGLGGTQSLETVVAGLNMVQIGGISLLVIAVVLIISSVMVGRQIRKAGKGAREMVLDVAPVRARPPPGDGAPPPRGPPPRDLPPRGPPPRDLPPRGRPPRDLPPRDLPPRNGIPPPRDLPPRPAPPTDDRGVPLPPKVVRRPPPPR